MPVKPRSTPASARPAPSATSQAPARDRRQRTALGACRPIPIRSVPRAAIATLVKRLVANGVVPVPTFPISPD